MSGSKLNAEANFEFSLREEPLPNAVDLPQIWNVSLSTLVP